jgi:hypothetical protein
MTGLGE